jgi:hypothetical protein
MKARDMAAKKTHGRLGSWQTKRLLAFADYEIGECKLYEMFYEKTTQAIPFKVLSVMIFFMKEHYRRRPGTLVALYRVAHQADGGYMPFVERYEKYYEALQERGCL